MSETTTPVPPGPDDPNAARTPTPEESAVAAAAAAEGRTVTDPDLERQTDEATDVVTESGAQVHHEEHTATSADLDDDDG